MGCVVGGVGEGGGGFGYWIFGLCLWCGWNEYLGNRDVLVYFEVCLY